MLYLIRDSGICYVYMVNTVVMTAKSLTEICHILPHNFQL